MSNTDEKLGKVDWAKRAEYLPRLKAVSQALDLAIFSTLERPPVPEDSPPTKELIEWAVEVYCFSALSHFREMLRSFLFLTVNGHIPAAFVLARCLFEMGAYAYYVHKHVTQHLASRDLRSAWEFLSEINMGNRYMREKGSEFPEPRDVAKVVRSLDEFVKEGSVSTYSYLSEYTHSNMAAYSHYYEFKLYEKNRAKFNFVGPKRDPLDAPLPEVAMSIAVLLPFVRKLLEYIGEKPVAALLSKILRNFIVEDAQEA